MLEKMSEFFERRLGDYDSHMLNDIESAREFYSFTAKCLPTDPDKHTLNCKCVTLCRPVL